MHENYKNKRKNDRSKFESKNTKQRNQNKNTKCVKPKYKQMFIVIK